MTIAIIPGTRPEEINRVVADLWCSRAPAHAEVALEFELDGINARAWL